MTRSIVLICRASLCRSPTAEVMLRAALAESPFEAEVTSAGLEAVGGQTAPEPFVDEALLRGVDLREREPTQLTTDAVDHADLLLTMTRDLLRTTVVSTPSCWPRAFTLLELVRRGVSIDPPQPGDTLEQWRGHLHAARDRAKLLGTDPVDDVRDPMANPVEGYADMFATLDTATRRLARLLSVLSG